MRGATEVAGGPGFVCDVPAVQYVAVRGRVSLEGGPASMPTTITELADDTALTAGTRPRVPAHAVVRRSRVRR